MSGSAGALAFELAFAVSPLVFVGGVAQNIPGGMLPAGLVTAALSLAGGLLSGGTGLGLDTIYPRFQPLPGGTLADFQIGTYPFANQNVAANATIAQPLSLSVHMMWPATPETGGYPAKLLGMTAFQTAVALHGSSGGTYTYLSPAFIYTNLILTAIRDITGGQAKQAQTDWQLDFTGPLLTLNQAQSVQSSLMSRLTSGSPTDGSWSSAISTVGSPNSVQASNIIPTAGGSASSLTTPNFVGPGHPA